MAWPAVQDRQTLLYLVCSLYQHRDCDSLSLVLFPSRVLVPFLFHDPDHVHAPSPFLVLFLHVRVLSLARALHVDP